MMVNPAPSLSRTRIWMTKTNIYIYMYMCFTPTCLLAKYSIYTYHLPLSWICLRRSFLECFFTLYHDESSSNCHLGEHVWNFIEAPQSNSCSCAVTGLYLIPTDFQLFRRADLFSELRSWKNRNQKSCEWSSRFRWWSVSKCFCWMWYPYRH